jgi:hypothetical protein
LQRHEQRSCESDFFELKNDNKLDPEILKLVDDNYQELEKIRISAQTRARQHYQRLKTEMDEISLHIEPGSCHSPWPGIRPCPHLG